MNGRTSDEFLEDMITDGRKWKYIMAVALGCKRDDIPELKQKYIIWKKKLKNRKKNG